MMVFTFSQARSVGWLRNALHVGLSSAAGRYQSGVLQFRALRLAVSQRCECLRQGLDMAPELAERL